MRELEDTAQEDGDERSRAEKMQRMLGDPMLRPLLDDLCQWLARILSIDITAENFTIPLQSGDDLCRLALAISKKASELGMKCPTLKFKAGAKAGSFQARCNIEAFVMWAKALGVRETCLFETVDIVELHYLRNVLICLLEISKLADVYGVEPPELVKLEKSTKISWQDLIKLSMRRTSNTHVMTVADITSAVGAIQREVEEADTSSTRTSSIVLKWKEFTRSSIKSRGEAVAADPTRILEDEEPTLLEEEEGGPETREEHIRDIKDESPGIAAEYSDTRVESSGQIPDIIIQESSEEALFESAGSDITAPAPELLEDCFLDEEDEDILGVQEILVDPVSSQPDLMTGTNSSLNEMDAATFTDTEEVSLQIETTCSPVAPTQVAVLVHTDSNKTPGSGSLEDSLSSQGIVTACKAYTNLGYEDQESSITHQPSTSRAREQQASGEVTVSDDGLVTVTWCFALCYPAVEVNRDGSCLTTEQYEELGLKRLAFLLLGLILIVLGSCLAVTIGVLGVNGGNTGSTGLFSITIAIILLAASMLALIIGSSLVSLWVVQHFKIRSKKLVDYETLPSYGTMSY